MPLRLTAGAAGFEEAFAGLLAAKRESAADVDAAVGEIIADVASRGDAALIELTRRFDRLELTPASLRIPPAEIAAAAANARHRLRRLLPSSAVSKSRTCGKRSSGPNAKARVSAARTEGFSRVRGRCENQA